MKCAEIVPYYVPYDALNWGPPNLVNVTDMGESQQLFN